MMKAKNIQSIICLVIFFIFASQAWAADWIYYGTSDVGDMFYDKSSIKKVDKSIISVWLKNILSQEGRTKYFSILKRLHKAPDNPSMLPYYTELMEIDCVNKKIKDFSMIVYDERSNVLYSSPESESGEWIDILPDSAGEKLINAVSCEPVTPNESVVAAPAVTENLAPVGSKQNEATYIPEEDVRNLITKWLTSWKSCDMKTYRSCYASDFQSKGMNFDAWISHKDNVCKKSKNINITIDNLQISAGANTATAVFTQSYSSSILKDKGKKTLELRKINDEWKIYREIM
ncbi:MAG: surface-adhesin E family protein [Smithella sp.]